MISRWIGASATWSRGPLRTGLDAVNQPRASIPMSRARYRDARSRRHSALPQLLARKRDSSSSWPSALTRRNAEISLKALSLGAADYIPKRKARARQTAAEPSAHDLIQKIRHLGAKGAAQRSPHQGEPPLAPVMTAAARRPRAQRR